MILWTAKETEMAKIKRIMKSMDIKRLKEFLDKFPEDSIVYGYEGEISGIVVISKDSMNFENKLDTWRELGYITNIGEEKVHDKGNQSPS